MLTVHGPGVRVVLALVLTAATVQAEPSWTVRQTVSGFRMQVIPDRGGVPGEAAPEAPDHIRVREGETYSIRLQNHLPIRVFVGLTVDGLNTISGERGDPVGGAKWLIEPFGAITLRGWQVTRGSARRFVFVRRDDSYAAWRARDPWLAPRCGEIASAFFWSSAKLERATRPVPWPRAADRASSPATRCADPTAETGMGERTRHPVEWVPFEYDAGLYDPSRWLRVRYSLARPMDDRPPGYAPEMP